MPGPIVFISHNRVKPGRIAELRQLSRVVFADMEAAKPATAVFVGFVDDDEREVTFIHVFADADGFERHVQGSDERSAAAYELIEPRSVEIYGDAGETVLAMFRQMAEAGVALTVQPDLLGGFLRIPAR
jgi:quinol monooxygenase YgiN